MDLRDSLRRTTEDIVNIFGIFEVLGLEAWGCKDSDLWYDWFEGFFCFEKKFWYDTAYGWNDPFCDASEHFYFPAATSIFVYRKGSTGEQHRCACADAPGVKESDLHVWLYVHEDENGESYRWTTFIFLVYSLST